MSTAGRAIHHRLKIKEENGVVTLSWWSSIQWALVSLSIAVILGFVATGPFYETTESAVSIDRICIAAESAGAFLLAMVIVLYGRQVVKMSGSQLKVKGFFGYSRTTWQADQIQSFEIRSEFNSPVNKRSPTVYVTFKDGKSKIVGRDLADGETAERFVGLLNSYYHG